jgi:hypothetical protein
VETGECGKDGKNYPFYARAIHVPQDYTFSVFIGRVQNEAVDIANVQME